MSDNSNTTPLYVNNDEKYSQWSYIPDFFNESLFVDFETRVNRMVICKKCSSLSSNNICNECENEAPTKTWMSQQSCPLGKW